MDALSSQANVGGYKAVLIAADSFGRYFPMLMTAAGTVPPAKVLVLGAGVAGLQAIATAKRLGAAVQGFDVRSVVKEQIESLGAKFVKLDLDFDAEAEGGYARQLTDEEHDVTIAAPLNLPSSMPESASNLYARNIQALVDLMVDEEGNLNLNWD